MRCSVCGGTEFTPRQVLWKKLVDDWQLSPHEEAYINAQQGTTCNTCGANLRSIALANALRKWLGTDRLLCDIEDYAPAQEISLLEINEAGSLSPFLRRLPQYTFGEYPVIDMHHLPYPDQSFDVVVHSDTLEHVANPIHALVECRRILKPGGALCFTVPVIVGRLSRDRAGLPKSYHGDEAVAADDFVVRTEFGADVWTCVFRAGFEHLELLSVGYPAALAFLVRKEGGS